MRQTQPRLTTVAIEAGKDPKRSPLFHWLMKNHKRLAPGLSKARVDWSPVIASAISAGVKNDWGGDPIEQNVRRTWRNVCQQIEADKAKVAAELTARAEKPPRKLQPRDLPKDWRPIPIPPPSSVSGPRRLPADIDPTDPFGWARVELDIASGRRNPEGEKL